MLIVTKEKIEDLLDQHQRKEVAKMLGCTYRTLSNKIRILGVDVKKHHAMKHQERVLKVKVRKGGYVRKREDGYTERLYKDITEERYAGASIEFLAQKYNKKKGTIYNIIHQTKKKHERFT